MKLQNTNERGFTIIEVVLVLAIAALIFLVVFLAVPALQGSQRDTQRRQDVARLLTQLSNYAGNNQGNLPATDQTSMNTFVTTYMRPNGEKFADPIGGDYTMVTLPSTGAPAYNSATSASGGNSDVIYYSFGSKCSTNGTVTGGLSTTRSIAFVKPLERGGFECVNN